MVALMLTAPVANNTLKMAINSNGALLAKIGGISQIVKGPQPTVLPAPNMDPRNPGTGGPRPSKDPRPTNPLSPEDDTDEPRMRGLKIRGCSMNMQPDRDLGGDKPGNEGYQRHNRNPFWTYGQKDADNIDPVE
jgi:hypothetical protein